MVEKRHQSNFRSFLSFQLSYPVRPLVRVCRRGQRAGYRQKEQGSLPAHFECRRLPSASERALLSEGTKKTRELWFRLALLDREKGREHSDSENFAPSLALFGPIERIQTR